MAITFSDNIRVGAAGKPTDDKYLKVQANGTYAPYVDTAEVLSTLSVNERFIGLTVNVANVEYWFKDDVNTLIQKGAELLNENDFASDSTTQAPTQASVKAYVDPTITAVSGTDPDFTITSTDPTNVFTIALTANSNLGAVSGILAGKTYLLEVTQSGTPVVPYQITFNPTYFSFDDGIVPFLKNTSASVKDIVILYGLSATKLQIVDVIYGS